MANRLYVIPASHPSMAARLMLEAKGVDYKRRDLMPVISKGVVRASGFPGVTVPALKIDGEKVQGTGQIARKLDELVPEPRLVPEDPEQRIEVEAAEDWGDTVLQGTARRIIWNALKRDKAPLTSYSEGAKLGVPIGLAVATGGPIVALSARFNKADDAHVKADLEQLPGYLDRIDAWIDKGVIGGAEPNVADYQIAPSLRLMMTMDDLRPAIENRPAGKLAKRVVPEFPGHAPAILPQDWLEPLIA
ncbi:MAG: glutathione S-transferase [Solirubrobacterales bacterium]|nr:glutathione S-transferase [Solirubrobacterales bacterium]